MKSYYWVASLLLALAPLSAEKAIPEEMQKVMKQSKYEHAIWGVYAKDLVTGEVLFSENPEKLFSPASTTKLFSTAALLNAYGDDYRFKTPVYATGKIDNGVLQGDLVLVAQGDLTFGGREEVKDKIAFTKMDHIIANDVPGAILTKGDPLTAINDLAKQVAAKGIKEIKGSVIIDDSLFETTEKRGVSLTPIMINENLIDFVVNPTSVGQKANVTFRPELKGYTVDNQVKTVATGETYEMSTSSDDEGKTIVLKGNIPLGQKDVIHTFTIPNPSFYAKTAFIQALEANGIKVNSTSEGKAPTSYENLEQVALWTSPPITEYVKLILKVSHNTGANLIPLLLAAKQGKKTFDEGLYLIGKFVQNDVKISPNSFVFIDGAGGNENRLSPAAELQLLDYMHKLPEKSFKFYFDAMPILGKDGSLEDFGVNTSGKDKVFAKPGTGVTYNPAIKKFFLITQALAGYIEGKNGHLYAYIVVVNNGEMPKIDDIFAIFEDEAALSSFIYDHTDTK